MLKKPITPLNRSVQKSTLRFNCEDLSIILLLAEEVEVPESQLVLALVVVVRPLPHNIHNR